MRKVAIAFIIVSLVINVILGLTSLPIGLFIIGLALAVGIPAISKLSDEFEKPSIALSVCTMLLLSPIAGIVMLCIPEYHRPTPRSVYSGLQCEKCGKRDLAVQYYTVNTALGRMNRAFCPECKQIFDQEEQKRNRYTKH